MKRLRSLYSFLIGLFSSSASSFFTLAAIWKDVRYVIPGLVMASIWGIIFYNSVKAEAEAEEKENENSKN